MEVGIENPKFVTRTPANDCPPIPPLVSMCLSMKTAVNPATHLHEIVALSAVIHTKVDTDADTDDKTAQHMRRFTLVRQLGQSCGSSYTPTFPNNLQAEIKRAGSTGAAVQTFPNERAMLSMFFVRIQQEDPDVITSHNLFGFEFDVLLARALANKLPGSSWSKLGRFRRQNVPKGNASKSISAGRLMCDTYKNAKVGNTTRVWRSSIIARLSHRDVLIDPYIIPTQP